MFRSGKYRHFQDPRNWPNEKLRELYKQSGTDKGMKIAITRELNARAGKTPLHSPQSKRQRAMQWAMMNANNSVGILQREIYTLSDLSKYVSCAEKRKINEHIIHVEAAIAALQLAIIRSKRLFPSKKSLKEKENA